jgi:hypothetical protein
MAVRLKITTNVRGLFLKDHAICLKPAAAAGLKIKGLAMHE